MKTYQTTSFKEAFDTLNIQKGEVLFIHSSLLRFGFPKDIAFSDLPQRVFELLMDQIGREGSLVVPTFNFDFCKGQAYNRQETPSQNMGVFSEFVRKLPESKRSFNPMQSLSIVGKQASFLTECDVSSSFDPESAFDRLTQLPTKVLLLGADFSFNSVFHWAEQKHEVPYRYWKDFKAPYTDQGETQEKTYRMFVRDLDLDAQLNFGYIEKSLREKGQLKEAKVGGGNLIVYDLKDFLKITEDRLQKNPYFFVENHPEYNQL